MKLLGDAMAELSHPCFYYPCRVAPCLAAFARRGIPRTGVPARAPGSGGAVTVRKVQLDFDGPLFRNYGVGLVAAIVFGP